MLSYIVSLIPHCIPTNIGGTPIFTSVSYRVIADYRPTTKLIHEIFESLKNVDACLSLYQQRPDIKFSGTMMNAILERYLPPREFLLMLNLHTLRDHILEKVVKAIGYDENRSYLAFLVDKKLTHLIGDPVMSINEFRLATSINNDNEFTFLWNLSPLHIKKRIPSVLPMNSALLCSNTIKLLIYPYYTDGILLQLSTGKKVMLSQPAIPSVYYYLLKYNIPGKMKLEIDDHLHTVMKHAPVEDTYIFIQIAKLLLSHGIQFPHSNKGISHRVHAGLLLTVDNYWTTVTEEFTLDNCDICQQLRNKYISL